jgi:hypothetical protein
MALDYEAHPQQLALLATHRRTQAHLLEQAAQFGVKSLRRHQRSAELPWRVSRYAASRLFFARMARSRGCAK